MKLYKRGVSAGEPLEYLPAPENMPQPGAALDLRAGTAVLVTGTAAPRYVCAGESGGRVAAMQVLPDMVLRGALSDSGESLKIGDKVSIDADGMRFCAAAQGAATVTGFEGEGRKEGDVIYVQF